MENIESQGFSFDLPKGNSSIIKVIGVGGGGNNALKHMYEKGIHGVDFVICNTDAQTLDNNPVSNKVQLGVTITKGFAVANIGSILLVLMGVFSLLNYKKRKLQILLNTISIIINALLIGILMYWLLKLSGGIDFPEKGIEPIFPFISIICLLIANVYIKKDEKLVKSVDRLR